MERSRLELADGLTLDLALPVLAGTTKRTVELPTGGAFRTAQDGFVLWEDSDGHQWGACVLPCEGRTLGEASRQTYSRLFALTRGRHLHRLWNFVPGINEMSGELENYRRFCIGRSEAFVEEFGSTAEAHMPAGSAVGIGGTDLVVAFLTGPEPARHFENPLQVPAYEYPAIHSPRPPSFARGSIAGNKAAGQNVFISGTAAVRGHETAAPGDLEGQLATTLKILASLGETMGIGPKLAPEGLEARQFLVYVRHPADLGAIRARLEKDLLRADDLVSYVQADICRRELLFEIEGTLQLTAE